MGCTQDSLLGRLGCGGRGWRHGVDVAVGVGTAVGAGATVGAGASVGAGATVGAAAAGMGVAVSSSSSPPHANEVTNVRASPTAMSNLIFANFRNMSPPLLASRIL
jgi:hypothetical protein